MCWKGRSSSSTWPGWREEEGPGTGWSYPPFFPLSGYAQALLVPRPGNRAAAEGGKDHREDQTLTSSQSELWDPRTERSDPRRTLASPPLRSPLPSSAVVATPLALHTPCIPGLQKSFPRSGLFTRFSGPCTSCPGAPELYLS